MKINITLVLGPNSKQEITIKFVALHNSLFFYSIFNKEWKLVFPENTTLYYLKDWRYEKWRLKGFHGATSTSHGEWNIYVRTYKYMYVNHPWFKWHKIYLSNGRTMDQELGINFYYHPPAFLHDERLELQVEKIVSTFGKLNSFALLMFCHFLGILKIPKEF